VTASVAYQETIVLGSASGPFQNIALCKRDIQKKPCEIVGMSPRQYGYEPYLISGGMGFGEIYFV
jgi:hypothetical protein